MPLHLNVLDGRHSKFGQGTPTRARINAIRVTDCLRVYQSPSPAQKKLGHGFIEL